MPIKNKIKWGAIPKDDSPDMQYELCGKDRNNKYVDLTKNSQGIWSVLYNNVRIKNDFNSREEAKNWAETVDLIDQLSKNFH